ncbi:MAG: class I SAM-dependent methyltransferase [Moraxellaceae bacterium]|nr:class I SAM-dependent methyltransferase [Moraxellaceae bacterium]
MVPTRMNADGRDFAIDGDLLAADAGGWRNLGLWRASGQITALAQQRTPESLSSPDSISTAQANDISCAAAEEGLCLSRGTVDLSAINSGAQHLLSYRDAATALARAVGHAANLSADDHLLELACGHGEGLALWRREFGITTATGMDCQRDCIDVLSAEQAVHGRFDTLPLPDGITAQDYDAVLCVDAAYHATSLADFASVAASALRSEGRLAFTTLMATAAFASKPAALRRGLERLLAAAHIPAASIQDDAGLRTTLKTAGFTHITVHLLDADVLDGFADHIERRRRELPWPVRLRPAWFKIRLTATLCRQVQAQELLHYVLVSAEKG